ncbi:hypothetical protein [Muricoccus radiodurans]|uniref:hypothetical protein n=1 Tax=Muricoccus radiodurans TaxID=2231721 RepID=UPI003CEDA36F
MSDRAALLREPASPGGTEIRGLVDNVHSGRVFGWAWVPARPGERLRIALRVGREVVVETVAEAERADLLGAGVGDGRHAFDLPLSPALMARRAELSVVARAADGTEMALPIRAPRRERLALAAVPDASERPVANVPAGPVVAGPDVGAALAALEGRVETLETWCLRLDDRLAALGADGAQRAVRHGVDRWQVVLLLALLLAAVGALAVTWTGAAGLLFHG